MSDKPKDGAAELDDEPQQQAQPVQPVLRTYIARPIRRAGRWMMNMWELGRMGQRIGQYEEEMSAGMGDRPDPPRFSERDVLEFARAGMIKVSELAQKLEWALTEFADEGARATVADVLTQLDQVVALSLEVDGMLVRKSIEARRKPRLQNDRAMREEERQRAADGF